MGGGFRNRHRKHRNQIHMWRDAGPEGKCEPSLAGAGQSLVLCQGCLALSLSYGGRWPREKTAPYLWGLFLCVNSGDRQHLGVSHHVPPPLAVFSGGSLALQAPSAHFLTVDIPKVPE